MGHSIGKKDKKYVIPALILILIIALALRLSIMHGGLTALEAHSLLGTLSLKTGNFEGAIDTLLSGYQLPLDFVLRTIWGVLFGFEILPQRIISLIFGMGAIIVTYLLGKSLKNEETGLVAASILALMPQHIYYSIEARMYSLLIFLSVTSVYYYRKHGLSWKLMLINLALLSTHFFGILIVLGEIIEHLIEFAKKRKRQLSRKQAYLFVPLIAYILYIATTLTHFFFGSSRHYYTNIVHTITIQYMSTMIEGFFFGTAGPTMIFLPASIFIMLMVPISILNYKNVKPILTIMLVSAVLVTILIAVASIIEYRYYLGLLPLFAVLIPLSLDKLATPVRRTIIALFIAFLLIAPTHYESSNPKTDSIDDLAAYLKTKLDINQFIILANDGYYHFEYFFGRPNFQSIGDAFLDSDKRRLEDSLAHIENLYFPARKQSPNPELQQELLEYLDNRLTQTHIYDFENYFLYEYKIPRNGSKNNNT